MITSLDHLIVAVKDLEKAEMNFSEVLVSRRYGGENIQN